MYNTVVLASTSDSVTLEVPGSGVINTIYKTPNGGINYAGENLNQGTYYATNNGTLYNTGGNQGSTTGTAGVNRTVKASKSVVAQQAAAVGLSLPNYGAPVSNPYGQSGANTPGYGGQ